MCCKCHMLMYILYVYMYGCVFVCILKAFCEEVRRYLVFPVMSCVAYGKNQPCLGCINVQKSNKRTMSVATKNHYCLTIKHLQAFNPIYMSSMVRRSMNIKWMSSALYQLVGLPILPSGTQGESIYRVRTN